MNRREFLKTAGLVGASAYIGGCLRERPNIFLITIDTLRQDHLGCYGYKTELGEISPNMDKFAEDSVRYDQHVSNSSFTGHAFASMFTGVLPIHTGIDGSWDFQISHSLRTLAEVLREADYNCISFNDGVQISGSLGFGRGFNHYESSDNPEHCKLRDIVAKAQNKLLKSSNPLFMFLHTYETHAPYNPDVTTKLSTQKRKELTIAEIDRMVGEKKKLTPDEVKEIINLYDSEIMSADESFGQFISFLKSRELYDNSMIILTSDHGEEFGEHGYVAVHGHTLYDELIKVPLIVKYPHLAKGVVTRQTNHLDLMPTILNLAGCPIPLQSLGQDLSSTQEKDAISQVEKNGKYITSIRTAERKYVHGMPFYFDLINDPFEQRPIRFDDLEMRLKLEAKLMKREIPSKERVTKQSTDIEKLKALGYLQ